MPKGSCYRLLLVAFYEFSLLFPCYLCLGFLSHLYRLTNSWIPSLFPLLLIPCLAYQLAWIFLFSYTYSLLVALSAYSSVLYLLYSTVWYLAYSASWSPLVTISALPILYDLYDLIVPYAVQACFVPLFHVPWLFPFLLVCWSLLFRSLLSIVYALSLSFLLLLCLLPCLARYHVFSTIFVIAPVPDWYTAPDFLSPNLSSFYLLWPF